MSGTGNPGTVLPITAVIPTIDRPQSLKRMLDSVLRQEACPAELVIVDASSGSATADFVEGLRPALPPPAAIRWIRADIAGAATQRNQGCALATQASILFLDDDVILEPHCVERLWAALQSDSRLGGVCATITNQGYARPGLVSRNLFWLMNGRRERSYAGRMLGPAVNLLPEDRPDLPAVVSVEWLNLGCTLYRRQALPEPPFDSKFTGYSMLEDATLSSRVGRNWKLANARKARIFHDSQPGAFKSDVAALSFMEVVNRHYVMTQVLQRTRAIEYFRLFVWELFQLAACAAHSSSRGRTLAMTIGKLRAMAHLFGHRQVARQAKASG